MLLAAAVVVVAIGLGVALALLPIGGNRGLGLLRTFALATSLAVVAFHLLPEATSEIGWWAMFGAFATLALPGALSHVLGRSHGGAPLTLELGYAGLIVHSISDGIALGHFGTRDATLGARLDVMLAVSAHTVPVVAVVVLVYAARAGIGAGLWRALGLAVATLAGVALAGNPRLELTPELEAWVAAAVSGLLLHIVAHGLDDEAPASNRARTLDLCVAALGLGLGVWLERGTEHDEHHAFGKTVEDGALQLLVNGAPVFVLALVAATIGELLIRHLETQARSAVPAERSRGVEVLVLSLALLGWRLTVLRALPLLATWLPQPNRGATPGEQARRPWLEVSSRHGAALLGGVALAAIAQTVPAAAARSSTMQLGGALTLAMVSHYSPLAATPLSAALLGLGVPPFWLVAGWCAGAFTQSLARIRSFIVLGAELLLGVALVTSTALLVGDLPAPSLRPLPSPVAGLVLGVLAAWLVWGAWRRGLRLWIWSAAAGSGYAAEHGNRVQQDPAGRDPVSQSLRG